MSIEQKSVNTIKKLALEMIASAQSGHAGSSLDCASILYAIYSEANVCPKVPNFFNRDRIVLSCGHASAALYATLHLCGYDLSIDDLRDFRILGSKTPGHPEIVVPGVDCTTGALGVGISHAVGMALSESMLASRYNHKGTKLVDHYTYVVCGDGDLMEGISYESFSLAGKWKLNKLIVIYNKNNMTLDSDLDKSSNEDTKLRFISQGFDVLECENKVDDVILAIRNAKLNKKPTLIICNTLIASGTMHEGKNQAHANPFSQEDITKLNKKWGLSTEQFKVDLEVYKHFRKFENKGNQIVEKWNSSLLKYKQLYLKDYKELFYNQNAKIIKQLENTKFKQKELSTVEASHAILQSYAKATFNIVGGAADLLKSTKSYIEKERIYSASTKSARNIEFGVRENAMAGVCSGIVLHGGLRAFCSTFLAFSDFQRYCVRSSAMMGLPVLYLFTHDSILLGQDGASHQPIEQLESFRLMPNVTTFRPYDANETRFAYMWYASHDSPCVLALSKQQNAISKAKVEDIAKGAYIISKEKTRNLNAILIATGSEVSLALKAQKLLEHKGYSIRVVSVPCREIFEKQEEKYKEKIIPSNFPTKVCIEAGVSRCWDSLSSRFGYSLGINSFGESGTSAELYDLFGFSALNISNIVVDLINKNKTK